MAKTRTWTRMEDSNTIVYTSQKLPSKIGDEYTHIEISKPPKGEVATIIITKQKINWVSGDYSGSESTPISIRHTPDVAKAEKLAKEYVRNHPRG